MEFAISQHAVELFREQIRPALDFEAAATELARLAAAGQVARVPPGWAQTSEDHTTDGWVLIGDAIALPVAGGLATTCLVRGYVTPAVRLHLTRAKRQARAATLARGHRDPRPLKRERKSQRTRERNRARRATTQDNKEQT